MPEKKVHSLEIEVTGGVAASLKQATGLSEKELKRLEDASKVMNSIIRKETTQAFKGIAKESHEAAEKVKEDFKKVQEAGEKAADKIRESFEKTWDKVKEFSGITALGGVISSAIAAFSIADLSKEGVKTYNARLKLIDRQRAILAAQGQAGMAPELQEQIERTEGRTGFGFEQQMAAMTKIAGARPGLNAEKIAEITQQLEDLAGTPEKLDDVVTSFTGVFVKGGLSPKALKGFFDATGLNLRVELAKTFGVTPDEMTKLMGKKGLAPSQLIAGLEKTLDRLTGVGGAFQGRARSFLETFEGIQLRWGYLWDNFVSKWGQAVEQFITPIANEFLDLFSNERMIAGMDEFIGWATRMGIAIKDMMADIMVSGALEKFGAIRRALGGIFDIFDPSKLERWMQAGEDIVRVKTPLAEMLEGGFSKALDTVAEIVNKLRDVMQFVYDHFEKIKGIMIDIVYLLVAERLAIMATNFGNFAKMLGGGAATARGFGGVPGILGFLGEASPYIAALTAIRLGLGDETKTTGARQNVQRGDVQRAQENLERLEDQSRLEHNVRAEELETARKALEDAKKNADKIQTNMDAAAQASQTIQQNMLLLPGRPGGGGPGGPPGGLTGGGGPSFEGAQRAEAYGPSQGEFTQATNYGPLGHLQEGDLAISPDLLSRFPIGSYVDVIGPDGNILRAHRRVADTSWKTANNPNSNTFELWNDQDLGYAKLVASHARGGIAGFKQLSWLAERGPEAVIPLNRSERSLELLRSTASALGARVGGGGHVITLNAPLTVNGATGVDSAEFANALREHAENIVQEIRRVLSIETERQAVV